jgi:hypothetical protein
LIRPVPVRAIWPTIFSSGSMRGLADRLVVCRYLFVRLLAESKSVSQALREFGAMAFGVLCMFLVA